MFQKYHQYLSKKKNNPKTEKTKTHLSAKGFLLGEKAGLFFSVCYHGHLSKDSIFLLEPSTALGKKVAICLKVCPSYSKKLYMPQRP